MSIGAWAERLWELRPRTLCLQALKGPPKVGNAPSTMTTSSAHERLDDRAGGAGPNVSRGSNLRTRAANSVRILAHISRGKV